MKVRQMTQAMRVAAVLAVALLAGCDDPKSADPRASERLNDGEVAQIAVAPDGTVLWGVVRKGTTIYFSGNGTQRTENCGKNCTRQMIVPNEVR